jgi:hypothetical protein
MVASVYKWLKWSFTALLLVISTGFTVSRFAPDAIPPTAHPLYISVTEMEYNALEKTLEISCKVFTDDFEKGLAKANAAKVDIYNPKDKALLEKQIADYVRKHLLIKADGKPLTLEYVGYELEEQSTWSYYQVSKLAAAPKKLEVQSSIFYELYDKQINIVHMSSGGNRKSTKLDYPATEAVFDF